VLAAQPAHGAVALNADGSFTYTPLPGYSGIDAFTYVANGGAWPRDASVPMSADSDVTTVTITVSAPAYTFQGFKTPLAVAGTNGAPSFSGVFQRGKAIPIKWQLFGPAGLITDLSTLTQIAAVRNSDCAGLPDSVPPITVFDVLTGPAGNSTYRWDAKLQHFIFNWDTTQIGGAGCYSLQLRLGDSSAPKVTIVRFK
jgi:hypothetical protein